MADRSSDESANSQNNSFPGLREDTSDDPKHANGATKSPSTQSLEELLSTADISTVHFDEAPSTNEGLDFMQPLEPEILEKIGFPIGDAETAQPPTPAGGSETSRDGNCETRPRQDNAGSTAQQESEEVRTTQAVSSDKPESPTISDVNGK